MKRLALFFLVLLVLASCSMNDKRYSISDSDGTTYSTDSYSKSGECITFENDNCACPEGKTEKITLCGSFKIKEHN